VKKILTLKSIWHVAWQCRFQVIALFKTLKQWTRWNYRLNELIFMLTHWDKFFSYCNICTRIIITFSHVYSVLKLCFFTVCFFNCCLGFWLIWKNSFSWFISNFFKFSSIYIFIINSQFLLWIIRKLIKLSLRKRLLFLVANLKIIELVLTNCKKKNWFYSNQRIIDQKIIR